MGTLPQSKVPDCRAELALYAVHSKDSSFSTTMLTVLHKVRFIQSSSIEGIDEGSV